MAVLCISFWSASDGLSRSAVMPYLTQIRKQVSPLKKVYWITFEKAKPKRAARLAYKQSLAKRGIEWLPFAYFRFQAFALLYYVGVLIYLRFFVFWESIRVVHCWCMSAGALGYLLCVFSKRRLILDSYEPHAEVMAQAHVWSGKSLAFYILFFLEKRMSHRANHFIALTKAMSAYAEEKYQLSSRQFLVRPSCVDMKAFDYKRFDKNTVRNELNIKSRRVAIYVGKLGGMYLKQDLFDFFAEAHRYYCGDFTALLLGNCEEEEMKVLCGFADFPHCQLVNCAASFERVAYYLAAADFGMTMVKPLPTKRYCSPIKNGEYMAMGLPIITTKEIGDDSYYIACEGLGYVLSHLEESTYRHALENIESLLNEKGYREKIRKAAFAYKDFDLFGGIYADLYQGV